MESQEVSRIGIDLQQKTYKYLGVLIGEDLAFSEHLKRLKGKLISASFMLNQSKSFLPFKARLQAYRSIFESHLNFATIVWSINNTAIGKLGPIQQKALRSVFLLPYRSHVAQLLSSYNIMKVEQIITSIRAKFIHNLRKGKLPADFSNFVTMVNTNDDNVRSSRFSSFNYCVNSDKTSPKHLISRSWNNLPFAVKSEQPDYFLENLRSYFNTCNDKLCQIEHCWLCSNN